MVRDDGFSCCSCKHIFRTLDVFHSRSIFIVDKSYVRRPLYFTRCHSHTTFGHCVHCFVCENRIDTTTASELSRVSSVSIIVNRTQLAEKQSSNSYIFSVRFLHHFSTIENGHENSISTTFDVNHARILHDNINCWHRRKKIPKKVPKFFLNFSHKSEKHSRISSSTRSLPRIFNKISTLK